MKNINIALLIVIALSLSACGGAEERKAAYLEKAEKSLDTGDLDKARIELKNVLQIDPKDARAYFKLGTIHERKQEFQKSFSNYNTAAELDPDNSEYQAKLGRFYLILGGDIEKATEKMDMILTKNKADIHGLMLKAGILVKQAKPDEAKAITQALFKDHPDNIDNAIFLSTLHSNEKQYADAVRVLSEAVRSNPSNINLQTALANTLFANKEFSKAEKVLKDVLSAHPDVYQNHMMLARFYQKTERSSDAEAVLRAAIAEDEGDVQRKLVLIEYVQQTQGNDVAVKELEVMVKNNLKESALRLALARAQMAGNNFDAAIATLKLTAKDFSEEEAGITSRVNLAKIYMQRNDVETATSFIDVAAEIAPNDSEVNIVKAKIAIYNKNLETAIIALRTVIKNSPDNIEAYFLQAAAHKAIKEPEQADQVMLRAYENNRGNIKALLPLARYHLSNKNIAEAERIADDYLKVDKDNYDMVSIKAAILNGGNKYKEGSELASQLLTLYPDKEQGYAQSVPYLLSQKKADEAIAILKKGYARTKNMDLFKMQAEVQIRSGHADGAIVDINTELAKSKDETFYLLLANAYMANKNQDKTIQILTDSTKQDKPRDQSYQGLAKMLLQKGDSDKAISVLKEGMAASAEPLEMGLLLASIYEKNKSYDAAIAQYKLMLDRYSDNIFVINNLAALLSEHKTDDESLSQAKALVDMIKNSNQPVIKDTVGWVYYKTGSYNDAVVVLKEVVKSSPEVPVFNYHLGMAYFKSGDKDNAKIYLEKSLSGDAKYTGIEEARATLKSL